ncbi:3-oxoacyl-[acyl-carrier-protein] synthase II [Chitinophaga costaii]|uniref:3-oxoacyl-[acyl-carrier-protein] synthase 2 n=1 Tax=Chitinophaga costaii TaxID=1335309 RepID=A0A1C4DMS7_9BACT|nr:beta-ketoacyl-ACP synthase II [Chitinophaga costaii]PUZ27895.1 beta-ketoacyl-[acyl-carrier-protein] synthase II [Chitinophaga costaii]SCC32638.1 3-oxoacyl-[acyl-carrier-protein] synthase II [Chitinophaga costaii]
MRTVTLRRVVITGLGALTPIGNDVNTFWNNLKAGKGGAGPITKFDPTEFKTKFACELKDFDIEKFVEKKEARKMDQFTQYAMVAASEAVEDARLTEAGIDKTKIGVIWASGNGGMQTFEEQIIEFQNNNFVPKFSPFFIIKLISDIAAGQIALKYGFMGINFCTVSACASSSSALVDAFNYIRLGKAKAIIAGGSEAPITRAGIAGFNAIKALSTRNEDPSTASRPYDANREGFVMGEGAGAIVLEDYDHAIARGAKIYGEMVGGAMTADAYHLTATHPEGLGARLGMQEAIEDADLTLADVDYINAHSTSTPVGDISELKAISSLFGELAPKINISATKSMTGHLLGAAGAIEAIACIKATQDNIIPPTINTQVIADDIPQHLNLTLGTAQQREVNVAMSNTFGFGGHNAIVVFKKYKG